MSRTRLLDNRNSLGVAPEFTVSPTVLDAVSPPGDRGGMLIGSHANGDPLTMSILRPAPTRLVTIGGLYLARQLTLRAMAIGAQVIIATGRPAAWQGIRRAVSPDGRETPMFSIRRVAPFDVPRPSEDMPLLVVHDGTAVPQDLFPPRSPWHTTMYVLPYLHPQAAATLNSANLVLLQRLPANQIPLAGRTWRLGRPQLQQLGALRDDQIIGLGQNLWLPITLVTRPRETEILGPIRRTD